MAWGGGEAGRLTDRLARCEVRATKASELDRPLFVCTICICVLSLIRFLAVSFFLPFSRAIPYKLASRFSVYVRPVCINALLYLSRFADLDLARLSGFSLR